MEKYQFHLLLLDTVLTGEGRGLEVIFRQKYEHTSHLTPHLLAPAVFIFLSDDTEREREYIEPGAWEQLIEDGSILIGFPQLYSLQSDGQNLLEWPVQGTVTLYNHFLLCTPSQILRHIMCYESHGIFSWGNKDFI